MTTGLQLTSTFNSNNTLTLSLAEADIPIPAAHEVVVRVEAAPLNPTDMFAMFGPADLSTLRASGTPGQPELVADIHPKLLKHYSSRIDAPRVTGSEGAGVVIKVGESGEAQALLGKVVSFATGSQHAQYACVDNSICIPMPDGVTAEQAACAYVNPMTALGLVETMRMEGHKALVNTAAASNLGIILNRICQADGVDLVNVVRKDEQVKLLRDMGAKYVVNSSSSSFRQELAEMLDATGATIVFDAIGGGSIGGDIINSMEKLYTSKMASVDQYGSKTYKKLYVYGMLNVSPISIIPGMGFAWGAGGWLLHDFLAAASEKWIEESKERIAAEITTTFKTEYVHKISLTEALDLDVASAYCRLATGEKYLICPHSQFQ